MGGVGEAVNVVPSWDVEYGGGEGDTPCTVHQVAGVFGGGQVCDFGLSRMKHNTFLSSKSGAGTVSSRVEGSETSSEAGHGGMRA